MGEFIETMLPVAIFFGGAQLVNTYELGGQYTFSAVFVGMCFYAIYNVLIEIRGQLRSANKRLWFVANPGQPPEDNPFR